MKFYRCFKLYLFYSLCFRQNLLVIILEASTIIYTWKINFKNTRVNLTVENLEIHHTVYRGMIHTQLEIYHLLFIRSIIIGNVHPP